MGLDNMSRGLALCFILIFFVGTAVGSMAPEFGNLLAKEVGLWAHQFNVVFLVLGIVGIGLALYLGYTHSSNGS